jgi:uncharacterized damage-inducible protein DinB
MNDPRYPIGKFQHTDTLNAHERAKAIDTIASTPPKMRGAVTGLSLKQLDTPYRDGGWTVRQVVHHVPDSHMTGYSRIKFALTQDNPIVMAYDEDAWAKLGDTRDTPIETSLDLLAAIHVRWVALLRSLTSEQFARPMQHSANGRMTVDTIVANYAWHGPHHIAHITSLRERMGW